ncbi:MAG: hypothetical protein HPY62_12835, partial [Bacteroidales bacterium]|nr:hypothetical protein [Bacteroidales bacterium]
TRNDFIYGETFFLNFSDVTGLTKENGSVFPGMKMIVLDQAGDTLMNTADLIEKYPDGISYSPLLLSADLTVAAPIKSGGEYKMKVFIWDKKGEGKLNSEFDFKVKVNDLINVEANGVSYEEAYIFSQGSDKVITDNKIKFNDNVYIIIEGLRGFKEEDGLVFPGLAITGSDSKGNIILSKEDLLSDYTQSGIPASDLAERVSANFRITGSEFNNPMHCDMKVWDKKGTSYIRTQMDMTIE